MVYRRVKRKRSKASQIMLLPALIFLGIIGYLVGAKGEPAKMRKAKLKVKPKPREDYVTLIPAMYVEPEEIINR